MTWTIRKKFQTRGDLENVADIMQVIEKSGGYGSKKVMLTEISGYIDLQFEDVTNPTSIHYDGEDK